MVCVQLNAYIDGSCIAVLSSCIPTDVENVHVEVAFVQGSPCISVTWDVSP